MDNAQRLARVVGPGARLEIVLNGGRVALKTRQHTHGDKHMVATSHAASAPSANHGRIGHGHLACVQQHWDAWVMVSCACMVPHLSLRNWQQCPSHPCRFQCPTARAAAHWGCRRTQSKPQPTHAPGGRHVLTDLAADANSVDTPLCLHYRSPTAALCKSDGTDDPHRARCQCWQTHPVHRRQQHGHGWRATAGVHMMHWLAHHVPLKTQ